MRLRPSLLLVLALALPMLGSPAQAAPPDPFCTFAPGVQAWVDSRAASEDGKKWLPLQVFIDRLIADRCLRINEIQVIGTHNSYHIEPAPELLDIFLGFDPAAIAWEYTHLPLPMQFELLGIRQIELDVFADPEGGLYAERLAAGFFGGPTASGLPELDPPGFKVLHVQHTDFDTTCLTFVICLQQVKDFSDANPDHVPIAILVEPKDDNPLPVAAIPPTVPFTPELFRDLDDEILSVFPPERIIRPDDVRGDFATLEEAILTDGWPTLGDSRGKVIFLLDSGGTKREQYRDGAEALQGRILFTPSFPGEPDAGFIKINTPNRDSLPARVADGYLVRTRADADTEQSRNDDISQRETALDSGAQWVSTDYPLPDLRFSDYSVTLPEGRTARCNPVSAPTTCRDDALVR